MRKPRQTKLIGLPEALGNGLTFDAFSAAIQKHGLQKVENVLSFPSPSDGFQDSLIRVLWRLCCNSGQHVWNSRAVLKEELKKSSRLATELKLSANLLWQSREPAVVKSFSGFVGWQPWQSPCPMHPSGIPWVALLDEFAKRTEHLLNKLPDDRGGPRAELAFDDFLIALADYYRALLRKRNVAPDDKQFVEFAEVTTDTLRKVRAQLPGADFLRLPPTKEALRKRLLRLNKKRAKQPTKRRSHGTSTSA
jgi:hypothetical protein